MGFNQVDNEPETSMKMAVLSVTGSYLPRGLTFGPVNGPEDFQGLVFEVFARRLYKDHFIFIDDLAVATGRKPCRPPGPSQVADVVGVAREEPDMKRKGALGRDSSGASVTFPMNEEEVPCLEDSDTEDGECLAMLVEESDSESGDEEVDNLECQNCGNPQTSCAEESSVRVACPFAWVAAQHV